MKLPLLLIALLSAFALWGAARVPFHPDESTQLFTSADFDLLLTHPRALGWQPGRDEDLRQRYRLLDAPLTRYLLGLGRTLAGQPPLPADWDWGKTWTENAAAGALPSPELLRAGRMAVTALLPLTLWLFYLTGYALGGRRVGLAGVLLLGLHPLVLLHARRAMAEGALLFGVTFTLWALLAAPSRRRPGWLGLALGLAVNAKQSALALVPLAGGTVDCGRWTVDEGRGTVDGGRWTRDDGLRSTVYRLPSVVSRLLSPLLILLTLTALLNPVFWPHPVLAIRSAIHLRADLAARQAADTARLAPETLLDTPAKRLIALVGNLYLTPPRFAEVGNYTAETAAAEAAYLANPLHDWGRGLYGGALFLALTLLGMGRGVREIWKGRTAFGEAQAARKVACLLGATALQGGALLLMIPLPWQRYVIPLLPMVVLWQAYAFKRVG